MLGQQVAVMREGRIVQHGTPADLYRRPADRWVAGFVGEVNLLSGLAIGPIARTSLGDGPLVEHTDGPVDVVVRPEQLRMQAGGDAIVELVEYHGHDATARVRLADGTVLKLRATELRVRRGDPVTISFALDARPRFLRLNQARRSRTRPRRPQSSTTCPRNRSRIADHSPGLLPPSAVYTPAASSHLECVVGVVVGEQRLAPDQRRAAVGLRSRPRRGPAGRRTRGRRRGTRSASGPRGGRSGRGSGRPRRTRSSPTVAARSVSLARQRSSPTAAGSSAHSTVTIGRVVAAVAVVLRLRQTGDRGVVGSGK